MNRRTFLRSFFSSTATIVVAPAAVLDLLHDALRPARTFVDMGRNLPQVFHWSVAYDLGYIRAYYGKDPPLFECAVGASGSDLTLNTVAITEGDRIVISDPITLAEEA